jgi:hypothetical protein
MYKHNALLSCRAHKLVEEYPDSALAWFGVGCYYMASRQFEQSRCFFAKATQLDKHHAYSWICFGHAFAEQVCGMQLCFFCRSQLGGRGFGEAKVWGQCLCMPCSALL